MWLCCDSCGHVFEEGELDRSREYRGECHGEPSYEEVIGCPCCGSTSIHDAVRCCCCGSYVNESDIVYGVCENCIDDEISKRRYDYRWCAKEAQKDDMLDCVKVNGLLTSIFTDEEINKILLKELIVSSAFVPVDCKSFLENDKEWIAKKIKECAN